MLQKPDSPLSRASQRRFSAWTLYARAFVGNRTDADDIVRRAINRTLQLSDDLSSERQAHDRVLGAIRSEALALLERRRRAGIAASSESGTDRSDTVLDLLTDEQSATDPRHAAEVATQMLRELPRPQRRALEMLLVRRPSVPLQALARRRRIDVDDVSAEVEEGLDLLAAALHAVPVNRYQGGHPDLKVLTAYVDGALSGDEARAAVGHCRECSECGDRLGTMMLLRSGAAKSALAPRVPRHLRVAALLLTLLVGVVGGVFLARALAPNPWAEVATADTVPRWFHDFLYGYRDGTGPRDVELAEGLDLLVRGEFEAAIEKLEPLAEEMRSAPEASAYLGIARYLTGNVSRSTVALLEAGTTSSRAGRIADWYLANTLLARGDVDRARRRLTGLAFVGDWVGRRSEELLELLDRVEQGDTPAISG